MTSEVNHTRTESCPQGVGESGAATTALMAAASPRTEPAPQPATDASNNAEPAPHASDNAEPAPHASDNAELASDGEAPRPPARSRPPAPTSQAVRPSSVEGNLRRSSTGWLRALQLATGLALLGWTLRTLLWIVGYRHRARLGMAGASHLELEGERHLMGLSLGQTRLVVPLHQVRRLSLRTQGPLAWILSALAALVVAATLATVLVLWGVLGKQPSWVVLGLCIVGAGALLDLLAQLGAARAAARGRAHLQILGRGIRLRLGGVSQEAANRLIDSLTQGRPPAKRS